MCRPGGYGLVNARHVSVSAAEARMLLHIGDEGSFGQHGEHLKLATCALAGPKCTTFALLRLALKLVDDDAM